MKAVVAERPNAVPRALAGQNAGHPGTPAY
jgi:hypothetical protein